MRVSVNGDFLDQPSKRYFQRILEENPPLARTEYYGLPGSTMGAVFADSIHKIKTNFVFQRGEEGTAGIDVGYVSSAMAAGLGALETNRLGKEAEGYHSNKEMRFMETIELAQALLTFFQTQKEYFKFQYLTAYVDSTDPGFISLLNTEAIRMDKLWFSAKPCTKIDVENIISGYNMSLNKGYCWNSQELCSDFTRAVYDSLGGKSGRR